MKLLPKISLYVAGIALIGLGYIGLYYATGANKHSETRPSSYPSTQSRDDEEYPTTKPANQRLTTQQNTETRPTQKNKGIEDRVDSIEK